MEFNKRKITGAIKTALKDFTDKKDVYLERLTIKPGSRDPFYRVSYKREADITADRLIEAVKQLEEVKDKNLNLKPSDGFYGIAHIMYFDGAIAGMPCYGAETVVAYNQATGEWKFYQDSDIHKQHLRGYIKKQ